MTSTLARGAGRSLGESVRPLSVLALSPALLVLLLAGLVLRLAVAYLFFPGSGFETDVASYSAWAATMAEHGPGGFYANAGFADYPPAYLYVLWLVGLVGRVVGDTAGLIKLPAIAFDLVVSYVIYRLVRGWTWPGPRSATLGLGAAALFLFNPVSLYDSALWAQTDVAGALLVLLGVAALVRGNSEGAAALAATAALVKPQFGVVLIPVVAAVLLKRHLLRFGSGPRHQPWAPAPIAGWLSGHQGPIRLVTAFAAAWIAFFVIALPFGMGPLEYLDRMFGTAGGYGYLSVNAYNLWALVAPAGGTSLAAGLSWNDDTLALVGPIPGVAIGTALLVAGFLWGTVRAAVRDDRWTLIVAVTFLAIAFFILPTRVHERYVFPAIALMPLLAVVSGRWLVALVLLSAGALINLHGILTLPLYGTANVETLPLGELFRSEPWIILSAALQTGVGLWVAWQLRPGVVTVPDALSREARPPVTPVAPPASFEPGHGTARPPGPWAYPALSHPAVLATQGWLDRLVARLSWGSLRRDRSALLSAEPGGRIDRRDVIVVLVLVAATLLLRGYRLDQPVRMYFDEVYHARTATEFLQQWEYGEPHAIYEFTHPHLAKYAMAWGIRLAGDNRVTRTDQLGYPVADAVIERRWTPGTLNARRHGDRLWLATGTSLVAYDLSTRTVEGEWPVAASAVTFDQDEHLLFAADAEGRIHRFDTASLDDVRAGRRTSFTEAPSLFSTGTGAPVTRLLATSEAVIADTGDALWSFDRVNGDQLGRYQTTATSDLLELPWTDRLVVDTRRIDDPRSAAQVISDATGDDPAPLARRLAHDGRVVIDAWLDESETELLQEAADSGLLRGSEIQAGPLLAVAGPGGIEVLDATTLDLLEEITTEAPVTALMLDEDADEPTLYAAAGSSIEYLTVGADGLGIPNSMWMPGLITGLVANESAGLFHALGEAPDGGPTVYVIEPRGHAVFADAPLPFEPTKIVADTQPLRPEADRTELLALGADGALAAVDIGSNAFGWRLPGMLVGALGAALLYLLARMLFARRSVALITAVLIVAEGMLFANSRIAMNDVYVTTFVILAVLLLTPLYLRPRRALTAVVLLLGMGLALGLGLASKWVALYAIGGIGLLILLRSALGRAVALLGMVGLTSVLGALAIRAAPVEDPARNWIFLLLMLLLSGLLAAGVVRRPVPFTRAEVILAVALPLLGGIGLAVWGKFEYSGYAFAAAAVIAVVAMISTAAGRGPWAPGAQLPPTGTSVWLRPGPRHVLPWLFTLAVLAVLPVLVYLISYAPWVELGNAWGVPLLGDLPFMPHSTDGGRTILDLNVSMYEYHNNLRAEHAASSPWWAWPFDLKPVWFFQDRYAADMTGLIYDTGNVVVFWLGLAGLGFSAWSAWRRRSLALAIVVIMWAAMWLPWARIDRATFQYHVYASLPFLVLALAYLLAELWHGPSARTWFLGRLAAALVILAVPLMWLLRTPLCILSGTAVANPDGAACASQVTRTAQFSQGGTAALLVLGIGAGLVAFLAWRAARDGRDGRTAGGSRPGLLIAAVALLTVAGVVVSLLLLDTTSTTGINLSSDVLSLLGLAVLMLPAWLVLRTRDPRRFVLGVLAAALLWLLIFYPNLSGLPLPDDWAHLYQGLLPTWNWDFQFAVNMDPASDGGLIDGGTVVVAIVTVIFTAASAFAAWRWGRSSGPAWTEG